MPSKEEVINEPREPDRVSGRVERIVRGIETPEFMKAGEHLFRRYLYDDSYAEEMKCRCGVVIWPVFSEEEALEALNEFNIDPNKCP